MEKENIYLKNIAHFEEKKKHCLREWSIKKTWCSKELYNFNNKKNSMSLIFDTEATKSQNYNTVRILDYKG